MTDRELRRLTREDLLDIIYELQQKTQRLEQENETIRKQLSDRTVKLENAGSIAEAALALNGVAQREADSIRAMTDEGTQQKWAELQEKTDTMLQSYEALRLALQK